MVKYARILASALLILLLLLSLKWTAEMAQVMNEQREVSRKANMICNSMHTRYKKGSLTIEELKEGCK